jgi:precorrin-3B synthase
MTDLSPHPTTLEMRRGACPALSAPMMTGDGLLARVALTDAISPPQLADLGRLARIHGNGILDISARGNLQIRGLSETSAPLLDADVRASNLPLREGLAVETPPLAGLDDSEITDPRPIADAIRRGARDIAGLAPKMSVVVDGHGQLRLSHLLADIRLVAVKMGDDISWKLLLGGSEASAGVLATLDEAEAVSATLDLLGKLASMGNAARGRDLAANLQRDNGELPTTSPFDLFVLADSLHAVGIGLAFAQSKAEDVIALCVAAERLGVRFLKPALDHSLLFFGPRPACDALAVFAAENGFITSAADPRAHIAACPGSPACRSASIATRDVAEETARGCSDLLDGSFKLHISGCPKGCAHPEPAALALCGTFAGLSLIAQGKATDLPFADITIADTKATLRRLADLVRSEKRAGENSAACLARLGADRLAAAAISGRP